MGACPSRASEPGRCRAGRPLRRLAGLRPAERWRVRPRRRLARAGTAAGRRGRARLCGAGTPARPGGVPARGRGRLAERLHARRPGRRDRPALRGRRSGDARPQHPGPRPDRAGRHDGGHDAARRGHGRGHGRRGVRDRRRLRLLQRDRGMPGGLRPASGAGMDGGTDPLVRRAAGPGPVQRQLPGPSRGDHAAARRVAGRARRGATCMRAAPPARSAGARCRLLPGGRAAPALRRVRAGGGGVPPGQQVGTRAAARSGTTAPDPGTGRCGRGGDPPGGGWHRGTRGAVPVAAGARRDHVRRR